MSVCSQTHRDGGLSFDAVIFDFDGVLAASARIKSDAFRTVYADYGPQVIEAVVAYHAAHEGISRVIKIKHCHKEFLGIDLDDQALASVVKSYQQVVEGKVVACPWVEGAKDFLEFCYGKVPLIVASGTPEDELLRIVSARGMSHYFTAVRGSPDLKEVIVNNAATSFGFEPSAALFLGDAMTDYDAAQACGCRFIGIVEKGRENTFPAGTMVIPDLNSLPSTFEVSDNKVKMEKSNKV